MNLDTFLQQLSARPHPVVVDVWAPWCGPCRMIEPSLQKLAREYTGRVEVLKINADENRELVQALRVYGIPTLLVYRDGQEMMRLTGAQSHSSLARLFEAALNGTPLPRPVLTLAGRLLRLAAGLGIALFAWATEQHPMWYLLGAAVLFSAVYDRCPLWQALSARLRQL